MLSGKVHGLRRTLTPAGAFDYRRARSLLAERMVTQRKLAEASGLSENTINHAFRGGYVPGELARLKLAHGLEALGIDPEQVFGAPSTEREQ